MIEDPVPVVEMKVHEDKKAIKNEGGEGENGNGSSDESDESEMEEEDDDDDEPVDGTKKPEETKIKKRK